jgi:RHS repeat-associated protein
MKRLATIAAGSGEVDWVQKQYNVSGSGAHVFRWQYVKDYSGDDGEDRAWVDYLQWTGAGEPPEQSGGWETVTYVYDPAGRRIAKAIDGDVAVRYLYDGDHVIAEYDGDDVLLRKFIYGPGVDQPICMIEAGGSYAGAYYYHFDGLGSVVALSDADGETVQTYEYSVFGEPAASDPNHPNPFLFTARRFDRETGLYHYRARAYNPYIGRFLQTDPANSGMNAYAYCENNPIGLTDPLGLDADGNALYHMVGIGALLKQYWVGNGEPLRFEGGSLPWALFAHDNRVMATMVKNLQTLAKNIQSSVLHHDQIAGDWCHVWSYNFYKNIDESMLKWLIGGFKMTQWGEWKATAAPKNPADPCGPTRFTVSVTMTCRAFDWMDLHPDKNPVDAYAYVYANYINVVNAAWSLLPGVELPMTAPYSLIVTSPETSFDIIWDSDKPDTIAIRGSGWLAYTLP